MNICSHSFWETPDLLLAVFVLVSPWPGWVYRLTMVILMCRGCTTEPVRSCILLWRRKVGLDLVLRSLPENRAVFLWFCFTTLCDWFFLKTKKNSRQFLNQSPLGHTCFPALGAGYVYFRVLIGSLYCLRLLWLHSVVTWVFFSSLVLWKFVQMKFQQRKADCTVGINVIICDYIQFPEGVRLCLTKYWKYNHIYPIRQSAFLCCIFILKFADRIHQDQVPLYCPLALSEFYNDEICKFTFRKRGLLVKLGSLT